MRSKPALSGFMIALITALPAQSAQLGALNWLAGCWQSSRGEPGSGEYWLPLAGGTMLGLGRTVRDGKTIEYEFLRLHQDGDGQVVYTATPSRQKETSFVATQIGEVTATFENPSHDFPQKIIYNKPDGEHMVVRIEGERQGKRRAIAFQFTRVSCPS